MSENTKYSGSMTTIDGKRIAITPEQAKAMWEDCERADAERQKQFPDTLSCLQAMSSAAERLRQLGWRNGRYCPRDGTSFAVCQVGSTGMWKGLWTNDSGKGPFSEGNIIAGDCVNRPSEMYFKPLDALTDAEAALVAKCDADVAVMIDEAGRMFEVMEALTEGGGVQP